MASRHPTHTPTAKHKGKARFRASKRWQSWSHCPGDRTRQSRTTRQQWVRTEGGELKVLTGTDPQTFHRLKSQLRFGKQQSTALERDRKLSLHRPCDHTWKQLLHKTSLQIQQYLIVLFYIKTIMIHQKQIPEEIWAYYHQVRNVGTAFLCSKRGKAHFTVPGFAHAASRALHPPSPEGTLVEQSTQGHVTEGLTYFPFYLLESIPIFSLQLYHILTKLKFATFGI